MLPGDKLGLGLDPWSCLQKDEDTHLVFPNEKGEFCLSCALTRDFTIVNFRCSRYFSGSVEKNSLLPLSSVIITPVVTVTLTVAVVFCDFAVLCIQY
jgi:hypothetical protein